MKLDYITIRTRDPRGMKDFLIEVFDDLKECPRPKSEHKTPGYWLYVGGLPIIRLVKSRGFGLDMGSEAIDHFGVRLDDYDAFRTKLETLGLQYREVSTPELCERRLTFQSPYGIRFEAAFADLDINAAGS